MYANASQQKVNPPVACGDTVPEEPLLGKLSNIRSLLVDLEQRLAPVLRPCPPTDCGPTITRGPNSEVAEAITGIRAHLLDLLKRVQC